MKIISLTLMLVFLCSAVVEGESYHTALTNDPKMTADEQAKLVKLLLDSEKEYLDSIAGLTEAQWTFRSAPFRWSVGETAEHIVLTETALFNAVQKAIATNPNPDWEAKTKGKAQFIERVMPSRTGRAQAPIEVRPSGKLTRDEVIKRFKEVRAKTLQFAKSTELPLKSHTLDHPFPAFGTLSAYDWLIYIPLHNIRHNKQIAEVKASPGYPE